jgi:hypothetical protein
MRDRSLFLGIVAAIGLGVSALTSAQTIEPFAGNGQATLSSSSGPAVTTPISNLQDVAVAPNGAVYLVDASRVRVIGTDGILVTVPGTGPRFGPGANQANIQAADLAIDSTGRVFVTDGTRFRVVEMSPSFAFTPVVGTGSPGTLGDGGPAAAAQLTGQPLHRRSQPSAPGNPSRSHIDRSVINVWGPAGAVRDVQSGGQWRRDRLYLDQWRRLRPLAFQRRGRVRSRQPVVFHPAALPLGPGGDPSRIRAAAQRPRWPHLHRQ